MNNKTNTESSNDGSPKRNSGPEKRRISSQALFGPHTEIFIDHFDEEYRLRITSNGKLILTK